MRRPFHTLLLSAAALTLLQTASASAAGPASTEVRIYPDADRSSPASTLVLESDERGAVLKAKDPGKVWNLDAPERSALSQALDKAQADCVTALRSGRTADRHVAASAGFSVSTEARDLHCRVVLGRNGEDWVAHLNLSGAERLARAIEPAPASPPAPSVPAGGN